jgi:hypothetical protein
MQNNDEMLDKEFVSWYTLCIKYTNWRDSLFILSLFSVISTLLKEIFYENQELDVEQPNPR